MIVIKRNGTHDEFNREKIKNAVTKAMREVDSVDLELVDEVCNVVETKALTAQDEITVEQIQDIIEDVLIEYGNIQTAKAYIRYRHERSKMRGTKKKYKYLSEDFISKYKHLEEPFKFDIGKVTYYRTYSRPVPEENRREYWWETVARVVDYSTDLEYMALQRKGSIGMDTIPRLKREAEEMYELMFNLKLFPSGRSLWVGGSPISYENGIANFNCSFMTIDDLGKFSEMLLVLMLGTGVGLSVERKYIEKLPKINTNIEVIHKNYRENTIKKEFTELITMGNDMVKIVIGDSRFGWAKAIEMFLEIKSSRQYSKVKTILLDYDNIRPYGTRIKTFGGHASGHEALQTIFEKIDAMFHHEKEQWVKIRPIHALDIATAIAEGVVAGGTRRSALIVYCDPDEPEVLEAKKNLYTQNEMGDWVIQKEISHRSLSNNTVLYEERPTREQLKKQFELIRYAGEPSFGNLAEMKRRRPDAQGGNPCFEIILRDRGTCNLSEVNMMGFVAENGSFDWEGIKKAQRYSAKIGYRMASIELELNEWDKVNAEDRLTGCSLTGVMDFINATDMSMEDYAELLRELRDIAHKEVKEMSCKLGLKESKLITTVKPSGTISLLPTVSSGVHFSHSPYYIRRIRINSADPLAKALVKNGFTWFPENGESVENHKTKVFEFPVQAPNGKTKYDVSALEQLELYKLIMENYVDHNASNTIHVRDHEWEEVSEWIYENWDSVVGVTFLSLSDSFYQLMPFEAIDEETYHNLVANTPRFNPNTIREFESFEEFELEDDCEAGVCPIR